MKWTIKCKCFERKKHLLPLGEMKMKCRYVEQKTFVTVTYRWERTWRRRQEGCHRRSRSSSTDLGKTYEWWQWKALSKTPRVCTYFTWGCVPNPAESIVATAHNQTPVPTEIWYRPSTKSIFDVSTCWSGQQTQDLNVPAMFSGISPFSRPRSAQTRQKNLENGIYWALHNRYLNKQCFRFLPDTTRLDWGLKLQQKA